MDLLRVEAEAEADELVESLALVESEPLEVAEAPLS